MKTQSILLSLFMVLFLSGGIFMLIGCSSYGSIPDEKSIENFKSSKNYNAEKGIFQNRIPNIMDRMKKEAYSWETFREAFSSGNNRVPKKKLPEVKPDITQFIASTNGLKVIWFGHSSLLLNMDGIIILIDPVFSGSASPFSFLVKRFQKPVLDLTELPNIDYILITHDHWDHLDMESIEYFKDKEIQFIIPLGVGSHLKKWGIKNENITEKDWWETVEIEDIKFTATPAQHFSGRGLFDEAKTLWASWVVQSKKHKVYLSGDSGYDIHFKQIGDKYGPFDAAFLECGQYNEKWREGHMFPEDAIVAFKDLRAKKLFPIHWGMFELAFHPWSEPIKKISSFAMKENIELIAPKFGEIVDLNNRFVNEAWWNDQQLNSR